MIRKKIENEIRKILESGKNETLIYNFIDESFMYMRDNKINDAELIVAEINCSEEYDDDRIRYIARCASEAFITFERLFYYKKDVIDAANFVYKRSEEYRQVIFDLDDCNVVASAGVDKYSTKSGRFFILYDVDNEEMDKIRLYNSPAPTEIAWIDILKFNNLRKRDFEVIS